MKYFIYFNSRPAGVPPEWKEKKMKVSELQDKTKLYQVAKTTEKAVAVKATKVGERNTWETLAWFPRSQVELVQNDFYINIQADFVLVPDWLLQRKKAEGLDL